MKKRAGRYTATCRKYTKHAEHAGRYTRKEALGHEDNPDRTASRDAWYVRTAAKTTQRNHKKSNSHMFITRKQVGNNMVVILTGHYEARLQEEEQECKQPCYENVRKKSGQA